MHHKIPKDGIAEEPRISQVEERTMGEEMKDMGEGKRGRSAGKI